jgi:hypothetical protein
MILIQKKFGSTLGRQLLACVFFVLGAFLDTGMARAQCYDNLHSNNRHLDSLRRGQLSIDADNVAFFRNNEFNSTVQKGYTLPGFILQMKAVYYPLSNLKLELGAHSLWYWGAERYPAFAYKDIAQWQGEERSYYVHLLPFYRAHLKLSPHADIVLGDIYGGSNHRLIEPLYDPELNLTSDPETGFQFLFHNSFIESDIWLNWVTYIYKLDTHDEAFTCGLSWRFLLNPSHARVHFYIPLQGILHHRGGEIDTVMIGTQTVVNAVAGAGAVWNANLGAFRSLKLEAAFAKYKTINDRTAYFPEGDGLFLKASARIKRFDLVASLWRCNDFFTLYGSPFYGAVSLKHEKMLFAKPKLLYLGADYVLTLAKGFDFGINADVFYFLSGKMYNSETGEIQPSAFGDNVNISLGVCLKVNTSFLIKKY